MRSIATTEEWHALLADAAAKNKAVVVDFTASWCGPCKMIAPIFEALAVKYPHVCFVKIDVDENQEVAQECRVSAMPTFKAFRDKKEVGSCRGANPEALEALVVAHQGDKWSAAGEGQALGGSAGEASGMSEREKRLAALEKQLAAAQTQLTALQALSVTLVRQNIVLATAAGLAVNADLWHAPPGAFECAPPAAAALVAAAPTASAEPAAAAAPPAAAHATTALGEAPTAAALPQPPPLAATLGDAQRRFLALLTEKQADLDPYSNVCEYTVVGARGSNGITIKRVAADGQVTIFNMRNITDITSANIQRKLRGACASHKREDALKRQRLEQRAAVAGAAEAAANGKNPAF